MAIPPPFSTDAAAQVTRAAPIKPLTRRALRWPDWPMPVNRLVGAIAWPYIRIIAGQGLLRDQIEPIRHFDQRTTEPVADRPAARDRPGPQSGRYIELLHVRYGRRAERDETIGGYAVYRHLQSQGAGDDSRGLPGRFRAIRVTRCCCAVDPRKARAALPERKLESSLCRAGYEGRSGGGVEEVDAQSRSIQRYRWPRTSTGYRRIGTSCSATRDEDREMLHLLVGTDTEGDNQWTPSREADVREHLRAAGAPRAVRLPPNLRPTT